jgi:hypothetical protein
MKSKEAPHVNKCGARTRQGHPCRQPAMKNGRCRMHGGKSTGPRTKEGRERCRQARLKTGEHTVESIESRRRFQKFLTECRATLNENAEN